MNRTEKINASLVAAFSPQQIEVIDESEAHRGHSGYQDGGESHFRGVISAPVFADMSRIARHRAIHNAIGAEMMKQIHALTLEIS
jgi:BolA protein